jgi:hypothetical protein
LATTRLVSSSSNGIRTSPWPDSRSVTSMRSVAAVVAQDVAGTDGWCQHDGGQAAGQQGVRGDRRAMERHADVPSGTPAAASPSKGARNEPETGGHGGHLGYLDQPVEGDRDGVEVGAPGVERHDPSGAARSVRRDLLM